jgi:uncharacterized protein RhaS with RHS repeats
LAGGLNQYQYTPNPTGWVDPLGLSGNCPPPQNKKQVPCPLPDDVSKTSVKDGAPTLPKPLPKEEAKRQVLAWEKEYDMHTVAKHGPEIPDDALKQRSIDGSHPTKKGRKEGVNSSSQFTCWTLQCQAIQYAISKMDKKVPEPTGYDAKGNPVVRVKIPGVGRGYKPNNKDLDNPKFVEIMNEAEVRFDKNNTKRPFTAFPR